MHEKTKLRGNNKMMRGEGLIARGQDDGGGYG